MGKKNKLEKIVVLKGGLGNQLFQYSLYKFLKSQKYKVCLDLSWYKNISIKKKLLNKKISIRKIDLQKFIKVKGKYYKKKIIEKILSYRSEKIIKYFLKKKIILPIKFYDGYWQDKFFAKYIKVSDFGILLKNKPKFLPKKYYIIHFRNGDFKNSKEHFVLKEDYYLKNIRKFKKFPILAISDDKKSAMKIIRKIKESFNIRYMNFSIKHAFQALYFSNGGISSNSTFCWWPIFLSKNRNWVMPLQWMKKKNIYNLNLNIGNTCVN